MLKKEISSNVDVKKYGWIINPLKGYTRQLARTEMTRKELILRVSTVLGGVVFIIIGIYLGNFFNNLSLCIPFWGVFIVLGIYGIYLGFFDKVS